VHNYPACTQPLNEILKLMDKDSFRYDLDITPVNHAYYYITATLYALKNTNVVDLSKALHYMTNVIAIVYRYSYYFENIPPIFYENIFNLVEAFMMNKHNPIFTKDKVNILSFKFILNFYRMTSI
jgi:hypothetical protein